MTDDVPPSPTPPDASEAVPADDVARSHRLRWFSLGVVAVALLVAGGIAYQQVKPVVDARRYSSVPQTVPDAPRLDAAPGETIYRIDPSRSSLTYEVQEDFVGRDPSTASGVTRAVAGDLGVHPDDLSTARVGKVVADIEQFRSDNNLRDARIRQDFLESHRFPLATFTVEEIDGLSGPLREGRTYRFTMKGLATVKGTSAPAVWKATAKVADGELVATATTTAKLSRFDAGPISISGFVRTSDDVTLTLKLTAVDASKADVPTTVTSPDRVATAAADTSPSYANVILPILEHSCASCHNTGQMAGKHIRLDTAADAKAISDGIKTVTQTGYMPPWPASDEGVELRHDPKLSEEALDALARWAEAGAPLDVADSTPIEMDAVAAGQQPRHDVTLHVPSYTGDTTNTNDYRCFVLDPKITEDTYLTGYTFLADQVEELHHAQVFQISSDQLEFAATKDGKDGRPGWSCYGGPNLLGRRPGQVVGPDGKVQRRRPRDVGFAGQPDLVAGWVPGQSPVKYDDDTGVLLHAGDALVMQIHYHYADAPTADRSGLALQLDPVTPEMKAVRTVNPLAPVEIPCAPEDRDQPMCDRDTSMADNAKRYGPNNEGGLLALCGKTPEQLTEGFDGTVARSSCLATVPEDGTILGVMGHMHTLGKTFRMTLDPEGSAPKILLDIPNWSFDWQMNYALETPLEVKAGQRILMECSWDRRVDPDREPKYIVFAEGTEDEMCFGTYSLLPDRQPDP